MRSIWTRSPVRCSPLWKRPTRTKRRRGARGARPSFKDAVARLADALAATVKAQGKLAQARNRLEAAARRTDTRGWVVARRERTRHLIELGGLVQKAGLVELADDDRATLYGALLDCTARVQGDDAGNVLARSEEHTSALQSIMRISYAVFCLKKKIDDRPKTNNKLNSTIHMINTDSITNYRAQRC